AGSATQQDAENGMLVAATLGANSGRNKIEQTYIPAVVTLVSNGDAHSGVRDADGLVPVAFNLRGREGGAMPEMADVASLRAASGGSSRSYVAGRGVRRLMPVETERLQ